MEAVCTSEMPVNFYQITRPYILEETTLHSHRYGYLISNEIKHNA